MLLQVIPSDARGQVLLAALHNLQNTSGGQNRLSPTGLDEETDSMSVHSSREDLGRKVKKTTSIQNYSGKLHINAYLNSFNIQWMFNVLF